MEKPFFSIIIPTLNEEKILPKLLNSLKKQTFRDFEVILVDGNSEDKTKEIFLNFKKNYSSIQFFTTEKRNVAFQRNIGALKANAKYLIFFDADVCFGNTFLEEIHLAAIKKKFKFATTWILPDSKKDIDLIMNLIANLGVELSKIINKPFAGGYNTIILKSVFLKLKGFREDLTISEDHEFAIRAFKNNIAMEVLSEPRLILSLRRYRSEGTLNVLRKYAKTIIYTLLKGPITHKMFEYKMGGHIHKKRHRRIDFMKINTYIRAINKMENKINKLLGE